MRQRHTVWSVVIGSFFLWLSVYATNQAQVQRYASVKSKSQVVNSLWLNCVFVCTLVGLCFMPFHSMPVTILLRGLN